MNFGSSILMADLAKPSIKLPGCRHSLAISWPQEPRIVTEHANQYHALLEDHPFSWMIFIDFPVYYFWPRLMGVVSAHSEVNKLSRDGKLRVREIGSDRVSMLKAHEEALRGQEIGFSRSWARL